VILRFLKIRPAAHVRAVMKATAGYHSTVVSHLRQMVHARASWMVVGVLLGIHMAVTVLGGLDLRAARPIYEGMGLNLEGILAGKWWQILSYGLLHGSWWHVALNAVFVLLVGSRIEHMVGWRRMLTTAGLGVLGGAIGHLLLAAGGQGAPLLVGFSGGCIALLLMLTTLSPQSRMMPLPISGRSLGLGVLITALILALIHPALNLPGFSVVGEMLEARGMGSWFEMGHACHFGGGMAGWLFGRWLLRPRITLDRLRADRERREASGPRGD
jgi:membrane associated rhomboid family serine protease